MIKSILSNQSEEEAEDLVARFNELYPQLTAEDTVLVPAPVPVSTAPVSSQSVVSESIETMGNKSTATQNQVRESSGLARTDAHLAANSFERPTAMQIPLASRAYPKPYAAHWTDIKLGHAKSFASMPSSSLGGHGASVLGDPKQSYRSNVLGDKMVASYPLYDPYGQSTSYSLSQPIQGLKRPRNFDPNKMWPHYAAFESDVQMHGGNNSSSSSSSVPTTVPSSEEKGNSDDKAVVSGPSVEQVNSDQGSLSGPTDNTGTPQPSSSSTEPAISKED